MRDKNGRFLKGHQTWTGKNLSKEHRLQISKTKTGTHASEKTKKLQSDIRKKMTGDKSPSWRGGTYKARGYVMIYMPDHPSSDSHGYIRRSRLVMEKQIERYLRPEEVVHHINGIKDDDRPENLKLFPSQSEHKKFHDKREAI